MEAKYDNSTDVTHEPVERWAGRAPSRCAASPRYRAFEAPNTNLSALLSHTCPCRHLCGVYAPPSTGNLIINDNSTTLEFIVDSIAAKHWLFENQSTHDV